MKQTILTPEESLLLISKTIEETKDRFKDNGHIFIFWGSLMLGAVAAFVIPGILLNNSRRKENV